MSKKVSTSHLSIFPWIFNEERNLRTFFWCCVLRQSNPLLLPTRNIEWKLLKLKIWSILNVEALFLLLLKCTAHSQSLHPPTHSLPPAAVVRCYENILSKTCVEMRFFCSLMFAACAVHDLKSNEDLEFSFNTFPLEITLENSLKNLFLFKILYDFLIFTFCIVYFREYLSFERENNEKNAFFLFSSLFFYGMNLLISNA